MLKSVLISILFYSFICQPVLAGIKIQYQDACDADEEIKNLGTRIAITRRPEPLEDWDLLVGGVEYHSKITDKTGEIEPQTDMLALISVQAYLKKLANESTLTVEKLKNGIVQLFLESEGPYEGDESIRCYCSLKMCFKKKE